MGDEITHAGIVDARLRFCLPSGVGGGVGRKNPDDVEGFEIDEMRRLEVGELAAKDEVQKLLVG